MTLDAAAKPLTSRYIAKCKACGCATSGVTGGQHMRRMKNDPARSGDVYTHEPSGSIVLDCRLCGKPRCANPVRGTYSARHTCSARCLSSTGTVCECSCAGKNHGAAHQVAL